MSSERPPDAKEPAPEEAEPGLTPLAEADGTEIEVAVAAAEVVPAVVVRPVPRPSPPRPWGGNRGNVSQEDLSPEELTPEMRWPPGTWVKVNDVIRHSTGEPIASISVGDIGQVTAALSQTLVVLFPTRDNRREVIHIDSIEAVDPPSGSSKETS